jgi:uncharacterized protein YuzE
MRMTYSPNGDALSVWLDDGPTSVEARELAPDVYADFDEKGSEAVRCSCTNQRSAVKPGKAIAGEIAETVTRSAAPLSAIPRF